MTAVRLEAIDKTFAGDPCVLQGVDLEIADGELLVLVGPSGCGKSTLLRIVAGLEAPTRGRVRIGERDVTQQEPRERDVAMVFQSYALYPHKRVRENLGFGLRMRGVAQAEIERRVAAVARRLGLEPLLDRRPAALSGGQRQRVALGRALARCGDGPNAEGPHAVLLDEPLSNLDARLRLETRAELTRLHRELGVTMIYVTHDQEEAMTLGDRIAVLHAGRLEQVAPPLQVYREPASVFVADFIGVPPINWLEGRVDGDAVVPDGEREALRIALPGGLRPGQGRRLRVGFRPADVALTAPEPGGLRGAVDVLEALGSTLVAHVRSDTGALHRVSTPAETKLAVGESVGLALVPERLHFFDAETGRRLAAGEA